MDELIVINTTREKKEIVSFAKELKKIINNVFIPITAGGGINCIDDAKLLFNSGADKLILNSSLYLKPELVKELIQQYGSQSLVASIDYRKIKSKITVLINDGTKKIDMGIDKYLKYVEDLDVGEIYLNSIDRDGTGFGYDLETIKKYNSLIKLPLIISGGAGNGSHFIEGLKFENISAVATSNLFNFIGDGLSDARRLLINNKINISNWF